MPLPSDDIIVAELQPEPRVPVGPAAPRHGRLLLVLGCGGVLLFVGCLATFIGGIVSLARRWDSPVAQTYETREEKQALLRAGFAPDNKLDHPDWKNIERLLERLALATQSDSDAAFQRLVDYDELFARLRRHPGMPRLGYLERSQLPKYLKTEERIESSQRMRPLGLHVNDDNHVQLFVFGENDYQQPEPWRLWLVKKDNQWLLADWERIDFGYGVADRYAAYMGVGDHPSMYQHDLAEAHVERAVKLTQEGKRDEAAKQLRQAEQCQGPPELADVHRYHIMVQWLHIGDHSAAIQALCEAADSDLKCPGFQRQLAVILVEQKRYEDALAAIARYEQAAGFHPELLDLRARSLQGLKRGPEALEVYLTLQRFLDRGSVAPQVTYLNEIYRLLQADRRGEWLAIIKQAEQPAQRAVQLTNIALMVHDDAEMAAEFEKQVAAIDPQSVERLQIQALIQENQFEHAAAAALYRQAAEQTADEEAKAGFWQSFVTQMVRAGQASEALKQHPKPEEAFAALSYERDEGVVSLDDEAWAALIAERLAANPNDARSHYAAGQLALEKEDWEAADRHFAAIEQDEREESAEWKQLAIDDRLRVAVEQGRAVEAFAQAKDKPQAFQVLASYALLYNQWIVLEQLIKAQRLHAELAPESIAGDDSQQNPSLPDVYAARLAIHNRDFVAASQFIATARSKAPPDQGQGQNYQLESAEYQLLLQQHGPAGAYERHPQRDRYFMALHETAIERQDWAAATRLCELLAEKDPNDEALLPARVNMAASQGNDKQVVALLDPWPTSAMAQGSWQEAKLRDTLLSSLARLGRLDEATKRIPAAQLSEPEAQAFLLLSRGDGAGMAALVTAQRAADIDLLGQLVYRYPEEFQTWLRDERLQDMWKQHPPAQVDKYGPGLVLLSSSETPWNEAALREALRQAIPDAVLSAPLEQPEGVTYHLTRPAAPDWGLQVTLGNSRYLKNEQTGGQTANADVRKALSRHRHWIALEMQSPQSVAQENTAWQALRQLTAALYRDDIVAVGLRDLDENVWNMVVAAPDIPDLLRRSEPLSVLLENHQLEFMFRPAFVDDANEDKIHEQLTKLRRQWPQADPKPRIQVQVRMNSGHLRDAIWMRVVDMQKGIYNTSKLIVEPVESSPAVQQYLPTGRCSVGTYEVTTVKME
jgi:Na+-transporting methylmalonyl-CoA/oxaloacetate decarboxylase gamma subunit